jgi:ribonuclease III
MPASATGGKRGSSQRSAGRRAPNRREAPKRSGEEQLEASTELLSALLEELPKELARQVFAHASWTERRSDSYLRLAFLGDSVLALAVTTHLYPRLEAEEFGAGRLTKIRAQTVSGRSCKAVAERLGVLERLLEAAPDEKGKDVVRGLATQRVLASVLEAVIGACYLHAGYERTAVAVVQAFAPEIEQALENPVDCKSALQELLAQRGVRVKYRLLHAEGPAHRRTFEVAAMVDGEALGKGKGNTKKDAEQTAAREALERLSRD